MPSRAKSICRRTGCNTLIDAPGYCAEHQIDKRKYFAKLDERNKIEAKKFYGGQRWKNTRDIHAKLQPLCERCKARGKITPGTLSHHNPNRETLIAQGKNPYDIKYLVRLCNKCHLEDLRAKRLVN